MKDEHSLQPHNTYGNNRRDPGTQRCCTSAVDRLAINNSDLHARSDLDVINWPFLMHQNNKATEIFTTVS